MKIIVLFPKIFLLLLLVCFLFTNQCVGYLMQAGSGQLEIMWKKESISKLIKDPKTSLEMKNKLMFVEEVREFARNEISLNVDDTYKDISVLDRKVLAWNVTASKPLKFEAKQHYFPITGNIPYLGYFSKEGAVEKANELQEEGWETLISEVSGYSTLGWFDDPLISTQLSYSNWYLAELVIHECTHATLWFQDDVSFNESFANFTGKLAARQFFKNKFGKNSKVIKKRKEILVEQKKLNEILRKTSASLKKLYESKKSDKVKQIQKIVTIKDLRFELKKESKVFKHLNLLEFSKRDFNNAYFMSFLRYKSGSHFFQNEWNKCKGNWKCFFDKMQSLEKLTAKERKEKLLSSGVLKK